MESLCQSYDNWYIKTLLYKYYLYIVRVQFIQILELSEF